MSGTRKLGAHAQPTRVPGGRRAGEGEEEWCSFVYLPFEPKPPPEVSSRPTSDAGPACSLARSRSHSPRGSPECPSTSQRRNMSQCRNVAEAAAFRLALSLVFQNKKVATRDG